MNLAGARPPLREFADLRPREVASFFQERVLVLVRTLKPSAAISAREVLKHSALGRELQSLSLGRLVGLLARGHGLEGARNHHEQIAWLREHVQNSGLGVLILEPDVNALRGGWIYVRSIYAILLAWMLPPSRKTCRCERNFRRLVVLTSCACGLLFQASHREGKTVMKASRGLPSLLQRHILGVSFLPGTVVQFLRDLQAKLDRVPAEADFSVGFSYELVSQVELYWGFARDRRQQARSDLGLVERPCDHWEQLRQRVSKLNDYARRQERRYVVFAETELHGMYFVPWFWGSDRAAYNMEQYAIRALPTSSNVKVKRLNPSATRKLARADHLWERPGMTPAKACELNFHLRVALPAPTGPQQLPQGHGWTVIPYPQLYELTQAAFCLDGTPCGPIDIYSVEHASLLLQWIIGNRRLRGADTYRKDVCKAVWLKVADLLDAHPPSSEKRSASTRFQWVFRRFGYRWGKVIVKVEEHPSVRPKEVKHQISACLSKFEHPSTVSLAAKRLQIVRGKTPTVQAQGRTHRIYAREFEVSQYHNLSAVDKDEYGKGHSLVLYKVMRTSLWEMFSERNV